MKKVIALVVFVLGVSIPSNAQDKMMKDKMMKDKMMAKEVSTITLDQRPGEFVQKSITVDEGTYIFKITNQGIDHNVGFVLVEKGKDISKPENHIQTAYVTTPVGTDEAQTSKPTPLTKGEYVYFCPLNPTATDNVLIVE